MIRQGVAEPADGFQSMGLSHTMLQALKHCPLPDAHPHPSGFYSRGSRRSRRHWPGQNGHREDGRLRHPADRNARSPRARSAGDCPRADSRADAADRRRAAEAGGGFRRRGLRHFWRRADRKTNSALSHGASTWLSVPPAACSTTSSGERFIWAISFTSYSMRPIACLTSGFGPISSGSSANCPLRARRCCYQPRSTRTCRKLAHRVHVPTDRGQPSRETRSRLRPSSSTTSRSRASKSLICSCCCLNATGPGNASSSPAPGAGPTGWLIGYIEWSKAFPPFTATFPNPPAIA